MYNINNFQNTGMVYYFSFSDKEENRQTYDKIYYKTNKYHSIASKISVVQLRRICNPTRFSIGICNPAYMYQLAKHHHDNGVAVWFYCFARRESLQLRVALETGI